jgi:hypothetical protein
MKEILAFLLQIAGAGLIALAAFHIPIAKRLQWREDSERLTPLNASIFHVHAFFICVVLVMMGVPCLLDPEVFLKPSRAALWMAWSFSAFWAIRLYCQWFVYRAEFWRGKSRETVMHWIFTLVWFSLAALFAACGSFQAGWLGR